MGIISLENTDRLYWLGRYSERVYTTIRFFSQHYDLMIDINKESYEKFCESLDIPNIYADSMDFCKKYSFDPEDPNSIYSNLMRAYDNAIVLRETIGSESLSYIQLAVYELNKAAVSRSPLIEFQKVIDNILAFWGISDDRILDENVRNIIKVGKRIERIDLYARIKMPVLDIKREVIRLSARIERTNLKYNEDVLKELNALAEVPELDYPKMVQAVESLMMA